MVLVESEIRDRVWAILLANDTISSTFRMGNRLNTVDPAWRAKAQVKSAIGQPGDYALIKVVAGDDFTIEKPPLAFSENCDFGQPMRVSCDIVTVYDKLGDNHTEPINDAIRSALIGAGTNLGLIWVSHYTIKQFKREEKSELTGNQRRLVTRFKMNIEARPMRSWITESAGSGS